MSSLWEQRAARNESLFREVNENIAELQDGFGTIETEAVFICECSSSDCTERLSGVDLETYGRVRGEPRCFILLPGHHDPSVERVVESHDDYLIVEKTGEAGEIAEKTQP